MFSIANRTHIFKKNKSLLDTKIGIWSISERSMSERLRASTSIQITGWNDFSELLDVI
jgi:hypothetical protein